MIAFSKVNHELRSIRNEREAWLVEFLKEYNHKIEESTDTRIYMRYDSVPVNEVALDDALSIISKETGCDYNVLHEFQQVYDCDGNFDGYRHKWEITLTFPNKKAMKCFDLPKRSA